MLPLRYLSVYSINKPAGTKRSVISDPSTQSVSEATEYKIGVLSETERERERLKESESIKVKQSRYRPGQAPEGSRMLRFPDFMTTAQDGGKVVSLTHRLPLPPRKYSRYSFLLEAESTPGP